jgi:hypothetical protein
LVHPQAFRPLFAFGSVTGITGNLVMPMPDAFEYAIPVAIASLVTAFIYRRDGLILAVTAGAIVMATVLFTTSTRAYDGYWFITLTTALTLTFVMAIAAIPSRTIVTGIGAAVLAFAAWRQPPRIADSTRYFKYPQYGTMVKASEELIRKAPAVRDIRLTFDVHPTMDRFFVYRILGGEITPGAMNTAVFNADGTVTLQ